MYLHIISGDRKFPPLIRKLHETARPGVQRYAVLGPNRECLPASPDFIPVTDEDELASLVSSEQHWDGILLNGILGELASVIERIPRDTRIAWILWGSEMYCMKHPLDCGLLEPETNRYVRHARTPKQIYSLLGHRLKDRLKASRWHRVLPRLSHVVTPLQGEFDRLRQWQLLSPHTRWHRAPVIGLSDLVTTLAENSPQTGDILVGNSATPANNHVDVFCRLAREDLGPRHVIVPLSYGDTAYRDFVLARGREILGEHFQPLIDFMPLHEYLQLTGSCRHVIMAHHRQQAVGNILSALWQGQNVYLGPSTVYDSFHAMGARVFSLERDFDLNRPPATLEETTTNRTTIDAVFGDENARRSIASLLDELAD